MMRVHRETIVPATLEETFRFFSDASNLERLTPPWLNFRMLTKPPHEMREGLIINYLIVLYGLPIPWRTRIDVWEPGVRFVDRQLFGPYRRWRHEHWFEAVAGGTKVIDVVEYVTSSQGRHSLKLQLVRRSPGRSHADCGQPYTCAEAAEVLCDELVTYCSCNENSSWTTPCFNCNQGILWVIAVRLTGSSPFGSCDVDCGHATLGHCIN